MGMLSGSGFTKVALISEPYKERWSIVANNIIISSLLHLFLIIITALSLPFLAKIPIDLPPIISIELIQITDKTSIPYAPKAKKII